MVAIDSVYCLSQNETCTRLQTCTDVVFIIFRSVCMDCNETKLYVALQLFQIVLFYFTARVQAPLVCKCSQTDR